MFSENSRAGLVRWRQCPAQTGGQRCGSGLDALTSTVTIQKSSRQSLPLKAFIYGSTTSAQQFHETQTDTCETWKAKVIIRDAARARHAYWTEPSPASYQLQLGFSWL
ncbi:hypothetical protein GSI_04170 [Ganoderma sinense ZZ0214-1]|uniref:Uncharacterized protein n=1 Tax=Ganoderma sinense ZZ0214-1 TaxID=1077348 RepID=A0A2G8SIK4_9APHY|nr:hypothetical protein GSI_04170 [Ganoderma sinense ZZ0214-1]